MANYKVRLYKEFISGEEGSIDVVGESVTTSGGIPLVGIGLKNYPPSISESLVWQLENFANDNPPDTSLQGQLWFDTAELALKVDIVGDGSWTLIAEQGTGGEDGEIGLTGPKGDAGPAVDYVGDWNNVDSYSEGQVVYFDGSSYYATDDIPAGALNAPIVQSLWGVLAEQGDPGPQGNDGAPGVPGSDGKSSYQVWLDLGNSGTEQQFIDSLKGADAVGGTAGPAGKDSYQIHVVTFLGGQPSGGNPGDLWIGT